MRNIFYTLLSFLILTSCNEWLDVRSGSEIRRKEHYKNVKGFQQTLLGCYIGMADNSLYGKTLSWYATELMGHQYEAMPQNTKLNELFLHKNKSTEVTAVFNKTWEKGYNVIVNANDALESLEEEKKNLDPIDYAVLKGELLALRAYIHFDLLRLFGYGNWEKRAPELNRKLSIPYVTRLRKDITPQNTGAELYQFIISDLEASAELLKENDPITKIKDAKEFESVNSDGFYFRRNIRLNYYAVRALQARVHQWIGTKEAMEKALVAATEVIDLIEGGGVKGVFRTNINFISSNSLTAANYSLFQEALFGLDVSELESRVALFMLPDFEDAHATALRLSNNRVKSLFEESNLDVRFSKLLIKSSSSSLGAYASTKLMQRNLTEENRNRISLIRIPEVYYIAAEAELVTKGENGVEKAKELLQKVRSKRGVTTALTASSVETAKEEIKKEYLKEFISEGVLFFYYKRLGIEDIPNMKDYKMSDEQYVIPFPDFEIQSGRQQ